MDVSCATLAIPEACVVPPTKSPDSTKRKHRGVRLAEAYFLLKKDKNTEAYKCAREDLAGYCLKHMTMLVRVSVYGSRFYPEGIGPQIFADECVSLLHEKYTEGIDTLQSPEAIHAFLGITAKRAIIDQWRYYIRRPQEPLERVDEEEEEIQILDELAADEWMREIGNRDFLKEALAEYIVSKEGNIASGLWIQNTWENPALTFKDLAEARQTSERTARRFLEKDNKAVIKIAKRLIAKKPKRVDVHVS